jgi:hypothetical protein
MQSTAPRTGFSKETRAPGSPPNGWPVPTVTSKWHWDPHGSYWSLFEGPAGFRRRSRVHYVFATVKWFPWLAHSCAEVHRLHLTVSRAAQEAYRVQHKDPRAISGAMRVAYVPIVARSNTH